MASALTEVTSTNALQAVWSSEKRRLMQSCFGVDRVTGAAFEARRRYEFYKIHERLKHGFKPHGLLAIAKPKIGGGNRIICVPTIADRLVQFSLCDGLRSELKSMGLDNSVSFGLVRGPSKGAPEARRLACQIRCELPWVYKADIVKFFDQLARTLLEKATRLAVRKRSLHELLTAFIHTEIEDGFDRDWKKVVSKAGIRPGLGIRQGMPLSPYFAGIYLKKVDQVLEKRSVKAIRYVDDIVAFFRSEAECLAFHSELKSLMQEMQLGIGEPGAAGSKTCIFPPSEPAAFLGMEMSPRASGDYCLSITPACMDRVVCRFDELASVEALVQKKIGLTEVGSYFRSISQGYLNAYNGAQNRDDLRSRMEAAATKALNSVLKEVFGQQLEKLSPAHRKFVGIPA